jgi:hypothetical protein
VCLRSTTRTFNEPWTDSATTSFAPAGYPSSIDEALEIADADGTASILDISAISEEPDYGCAAPFTPAELKQYFGSERPTRADIEQAEDYWDDLERGQARYAVVYAGGAPSEIYFAGYSFD